MPVRPELKQGSRLFAKNESRPGIYAPSES
jgi:hypothetical protein